MKNKDGGERGSRAKRELQALWDKLYPDDPHTIEKTRLRGYEGRKHSRYVWVASEPTGLGFRTLGGDARSARESIRAWRN